jgi:uncharacterized protein (TIGR00730 family)
MTEETKKQHTHLTPEDIKKGCLETVEGDDPNSVRICRINKELVQGMKEMEAYERSVTFYGSARFKEGDEFYDKARNLGSRIAKELGFAVITGGGPGIMEAGNRGAFEAGGKSVGASIRLPMEQHDNPYTTDAIPFNFFFARKVALSFSSEVFVYFPGGFGTLDECFEVVTLLQTGKLKPIPVILYGTEFWNPLMDFARKIMLEKYKTISEEDFNIFTVTDDDDLVLETIRKAKDRKDNRLD